MLNNDLLNVLEEILGEEQINVVIDGMELLLKFGYEKHLVCIEGILERYNDRDLSLSNVYTTVIDELNLSVNNVLSLIGVVVSTDNNISDKVGLLNIIEQLKDSSDDTVSELKSVIGTIDNVDFVYYLLDLNNVDKVNRIDIVDVKDEFIVYIEELILYRDMSSFQDMVTFSQLRSEFTRITGKSVTDSEKNIFEVRDYKLAIANDYTLLDNDMKTTLDNVVALYLFSQVDKDNSATFVDFIIDNSTVNISEELIYNELSKTHKV